MANTPVRQYIGARYVPLFADPAEWNNQRTYEPLTIVIHEGNSYTARQYVPAGIDITNNVYWANTGNYNAQIEQYRQETASKLNTVAHDDSLTGEGTINNPLKLADNIKNNNTLYKTRIQRNYVLLGDSWSVVHNYALYNQLKRINPHSKWYNYGINGSIIQQLPQQIAKAKQDTTLQPEEITDVIIVMGTNNVFWENENNENDLIAAFQSVKDYFPTANIHYFPNNSKTLNEGRNSLYRIIIDSAIQANIQVHPESLYWLAGHIQAYNGNDQEGVQHLSDNGYASFAYFINNIVQGGSPFYSSQWIQTIEYRDYHNPTSADDINSDTIKIVNIDNTGAIKTVGYLTNAFLQLTYYADEKIDMAISGNVKIIQSTIYNNWYMTCDNWNAKIAPHTLPYIFLGNNYKIYNQPAYSTHLSNDFYNGFASLESSRSTAKNIYISVPLIDSDKNNFYMKFDSAPTSITNFGL